MNNIRERVFRVFPRDCKSARIYRATRNDTIKQTEGEGERVRPSTARRRELFDELECRVDVTSLFVSDVQVETG